MLMAPSRRALFVAALLALLASASAARVLQQNEVPDPDVGQETDSDSELEEHPWAGAGGRAPAGGRAWVGSCLMHKAGLGQLLRLTACTRAPLAPSFQQRRETRPPRMT